MSATVEDLLNQVFAAGGELTPTGPDRIYIRAPAPLPEALMAQLRKHKPEILARLGVRRPYAFRLRNGEGGGTYLTTAPTVEAARHELTKIYRDRLLLVVEA